MIEIVLVSKPAIWTGIAASNLLVDQQSDILKSPVTKPTSIHKQTGTEHSTGIAGLLLVAGSW